MYSLLSKGVTAARWYDQAARNVACMAQTLALTNTKPCDLDRVSFSVIAPQGQRPFFSNELSPASIRMKIQMRIDQFQGQGLEELVLWREEYLKPMIDRMEKEGMISFLSWEELIGKITNESTKAAVGAFYKKCEEVSRITQQQIIANGPTRGGQYRVKGEIEPRGIVVCCYPGQTKSRVYRKDNHDASYLENNANLEPVDLPPVKFSDPHIGDELDYEGKKVRVISSGPCRCKVECVDSPGPILLVDNHLMQRATKR
ncbi:hypothetical protein [Schlesneria sp.]|uniref:hypothetical protein n=1 Tax=Schlesneria sp. TaxID=2762018 RepID=UPI002F0BC36B